MKQTTIDDFIGLEAAHLRAEVGMTRAADKAERVEPGWREVALDALRRHARTHTSFLAEHIHFALPAGADRRAVGAVIREAVRLGWIEADGFAAACSSNGSPKVRWRSLIAVAP